MIIPPKLPSGEYELQDGQRCTVDDDGKIDCREHARLHGQPYGRSRFEQEQMNYKTKNRIFNAVLLALVLAALAFCVWSMVGCTTGGSQTPAPQPCDTIVRVGPRQAPLERPCE